MRITADINLELETGTLDAVPAEFYVEPFKDLITNQACAVVCLVNVKLHELIIEGKQLKLLLTTDQVDYLEKQYREEFLQGQLSND